MANAELALGALAKPDKGSRKREKARFKALASKQAQVVRAKCVERDGRCLLLTRMGSALGTRHGLLALCFGPSEWAHIGQHRRCHTRGMAAEKRHTTAGSGMMCQRHHAAYDAHEFDLEPLTADGMDGGFRVVRRAT